MYQLNFTKEFIKKSKKIIKKDPALKNRVKKSLELLRKNPFYPSLKSHKVQSKNFGICQSSRVTKDIRIIWNYDKNGEIFILILTIGGHSGKNKVYN
jgi:mRNA-degrading endonuclease YafQ of YafQ-DinJ toxin-antitoxin module